MVIDFENAMMRALTAVFGNHIAAHGCFYHLTQSTWRKVQDLSLVNQCKDSEDVELFCSMIDSLVCLPLDDLSAGWSGAASGLLWFHILQRYTQKSQSTGWRWTRRHRASMQSSTVSTRHVECTPSNTWWRTAYKYLSDACNCLIDHLCGVSHLSVWKLLHWLKAECAQVSTTLLNASCGELPRSRVKRVNVRHQSSLYQLCVDRSEGTKTVGEFLRDAGHNIRWKPHANQVNEQKKNNPAIISNFSLCHLFQV